MQAGNIYAGYNPILDTDSYKPSHYRQLPKNSQYVSEYVESRSEDVDIVFFGLKQQLHKWEQNPITEAMIREANDYLVPHGVPFNKEGWEYIVDVHEGRLPLAIEAVPEGTVVRGQNVVAQLINTDERLPWLPGYVEPPMLRSCWYPSSVATLSRECRKVIKYYLELTADSIEGLDFKLHDFGARGATTEEAAGIGGAAHLAVGWQGTDTISALRVAREVYGCPMAGFSIPASEHSTVTSWGREHEFDAYENMIDQFGGDGKIFANVIDSYDPMAAIEKGFGGTLREKVINNGGTIVLRPDSGNPVTMSRDIILKCMDVFGCEFNEKGYKVLPGYIRVIYGDGINRTSIGQILEELRVHRISAENIAFGMGGALLQGVTRDTYRWAMKASSIMIQGTWHDVYKDPITDSGKRSKRGRLALINNDGNWETVSRDLAVAEGWLNHLVPVFKDGKILHRSNFDDIRRRAAV